MMKKKIISIIFAVVAICGFSALNAMAEVYVEVPVDISPRFNSNVFLSEGEIGTERAVKPNFFISKDGNEPFALNRDKLKEYLDEDGYTKTGTKYYIDINNIDKNAVYANQGGKGDPIIPKGYYVGYRVLATSTKRDTSNNGVIYVGLPTKNVPNRSARHDVWGHNDAGAPTPYMPLGTVGINDGVVSEIGGNIYEIEKMIPQNSGDSEDEKKYGIMPTKISFWSESPSTVRILALTLLMSEAGAKKKLEDDISSLLSGTPTTETVLEIDKYIDEIVEAGVNIEGTKGLEEFNALKAKFVKVVDTSSVTDDDFVKIDVNFSCEIAPDSINKNNFRVEQAGVELDFELEELVDEGKVTGVRIVAENTMNYIDDIKVTVFGNIKNAEDESFTLGNSYEFVAEHKAPSVYIKNVSKNGNNIKVELSNNSQEEKTYALTVAIYTNDDEMKDCYIKTGKLAENLIIDDISFDIQADDRLECYLLETFTSMKSANCLMEVK